MKRFVFLFSAVFLSFALTGCATWEGVKQDSSDAWEKTKEVSSDAYDSTKKAIHEATE